MLFLVSPDKFKGSLSAIEVCKAIEKGLYGHKDDIKTVLLPLADGGEGSLSILKNYITAKRIIVDVRDPIGKAIKASYLLDGKNAYIELALASGLTLLDKAKRNPMYTTTHGTGELILDAINRGAKDVFLFVGGSSTNDAGTGILNALGYRFMDQSGTELYPAGENLIKICAIENNNLKYNPASVSFYVLSDVKNKLTGLNGAAYIYAKQKGASRSEIEILDDGLRNFSKIVKRETGLDISNVKGGGAAGGVAAGMYGLAGAEIKSGIDFFIDITEFRKYLEKTDYVVSGEGKLDKQSLQGKVISKIAQLAKEHNKPLVLFVGKNELPELDLGKLNPFYIDDIISHSIDINDAMKNSKNHLENMVKIFLGTDSLFHLY
jgi:glycerate kinase